MLYSSMFHEVLTSFSGYKMAVPHLNCLVPSLEHSWEAMSLMLAQPRNTGELMLWSSPLTSGVGADEPLPPITQRTVPQDIC